MTMGLDLSQYPSPEGEMTVVLTVASLLVKAFEGVEHVFVVRAFVELGDVRRSHSSVVNLRCFIEPVG